ncbi:MAG: hypothetical protein CSA26_08375 [Desulfobacterales bacterium]|nr:MAG: hypothetical protein CSA26_08375 [Desulfobacterales bacterium]
MEKCPHCRARLREERTCPRCRTDLTLALDIETEARIMAGQAVTSLASGDAAAAAKYAEKSKKLHNTLFSRVLLEFCSAAYTKTGTPPFYR